MAINVSPWSVKGVDPEARGAAKIAARRAGLTIGSWLSQTIRAAAAEQLTSTKQLHTPIGDNPGQDRFSQHHNPENQYNPQQQYKSGQQYNPSQEYNSGQGLYPRVGQTGSSGFKNTPQSQPVNGYGQQSTSGYTIGSQPIPAATIQGLLDSIQLLNNRLEQAEFKTTATMAPLAEQVSQLSQNFDQVKTQKGTSTAPVERALMSILERLDKMEEGHNQSPRSQNSWWRRNRD